MDWPWRKDYSCIQFGFGNNMYMYSIYYCFPKNEVDPELQLCPSTRNCEKTYTASEEFLDEPG